MKTAFNALVKPIGHCDLMNGIFSALVITKKPLAITPYCTDSCDRSAAFAFMSKQMKKAETRGNNKKYNVSCFVLGVLLGMIVSGTMA